jgi:trk system potassium uptake protein TrkA
VKAIVIGCGRVGSSIARQLLSEGWEVTAIDEKEDALARLGEGWPGGFVLGHGMDVDVLRSAGIEEADAVVVSTDGDNTNIVISQIAKRRFNVPTVVARILDPLRAEWYSKQGVNTVCPTRIAIEMLEKEVLQAAGAESTS